MILTGLKIQLHLEKVLQKTITKIFFEADVQYPEKSYNIHDDLPFFPVRMKIEIIGKKLKPIFMIKRMLYTHEKIKTSIESWITFQDSAESH